MKVSGSLVMTGLISVFILSFSCGWFNELRGDGGETVKARAEVKGFIPGTVQGTIYFSEDPMKGLHISGEIRGLLPDSTYAIHIRENGNCSDSTAPGRIFDPANSGVHGTPGASPGSSQAGGLPNIKANGNGVAKVDFITNALGVGDSEFSVINKSIVVKFYEDDYETQPEGGSGPSVACGVIEDYTGKK